MKSSRFFSPFRAMFPPCIQRHSKKTLVCVFWLLGNLQILCDDLDAILLSPENYERNSAVEKVSIFVFICTTANTPAKNHRAPGNPPWRILTTPVRGFV